MTLGLWQTTIICGISLLALAGIQWYTYQPKANVAEPVQKYADNPQAKEDYLNAEDGADYSTVKSLFGIDENQETE
ncbi:MAG: hypothetical protein F6K47_05415 [Symploca sp. SIO2E6]|nr:hypothetical protein [Symploca sp. SIO2E6]